VIHLYAFKTFIASDTHYFWTNSMPNRSKVDYKPVIKEEYTYSLEEIPVSEETTNPMSSGL
jgi:plasmid rolling circle replication initiator protein Rep